jgi:hypothetical protein
VANATLLFIFISQIGNETSTFFIQYFAWGLLGGVDVKGSGGLLVLICIDVIVVIGFKSAGDLLCHSPMGIDSADIRQQPNGELCMDKSHLLPNNPARQ